jgi:hypothetical protein
LEDLVLLVGKNYFSMHHVESQLLKRFNLHLCPKVILFFRKQFSKNILPKLLAKIKQLYVLLALANCYYNVISFDLWMSKGAYDIFAFITNCFGG